MRRVDLINIGDDFEAQALRGVIEYFGFTVTLHNLATAQQCVTLLDGSTPLADIVVLLCHGDQGGLVLPELDAAIEAQQPFSQRISASQLPSFLKIQGKVLINTGCTLGEVAYADAFRAGGCKAYIGASDYVDGSASLLYVAQFFYECAKSSDINAAHRKAADYDAETALFRLYEFEREAAA